MPLRFSLIARGRASSSWYLARSACVADLDLALSPRRGPDRAVHPGGWYAATATLGRLASRRRARPAGSAWPGLAVEAPRAADVIVVAGGIGLSPCARSSTICSRGVTGSEARASTTGLDAGRPAACPGSRSVGPAAGHRPCRDRRPRGPRAGPGPVGVGDPPLRRARGTRPRPSPSCAAPNA